MFRVRLTRDDRTNLAMFQALARKSIGSRKYKTHANAADQIILCARSRQRHESQQLPIRAKRLINPPDQRVDVG